MENPYSSPNRERQDSTDIDSIDVDVDRVLWSDDPEKAYFQGMMDEKRQSRLANGDEMDDSVLGEQTLASLEERKAPPNPFKKSKVDYIPTYFQDTESESEARPTDMAYVGETDDVSTIANDTLGGQWVTKSNPGPRTPDKSSHRDSPGESGDRNAPGTPPGYVKYPFKPVNDEGRAVWDARKYKYACAVGIFLICAIAALSSGLSSIRSKKGTPKQNPLETEWTTWTFRPTDSSTVSPRPSNAPTSPGPTRAPTTKAPTKPPTGAPTTKGPTATPTIAPTESQETVVISALQGIDTLSGTNFATSIENIGSPQEQAFNWLTNDPNFYSYSDNKVIQRYSLAIVSTELKSSSTRRRLGRNLNWLQLQYTDECSWFDQEDPVCDEAGNLINLDLRNKGLDGSIPSELFLLTNLETLDLSENMLNGAIPPSIELMANLMELYLNFNSLGGGIPKEVGGLKKLDVFDLSHNAFTGPIPKEVGKMKSLDILNLSFNQLTGFISGDLGKLKELRLMDLRSNQLAGTVPLKFMELFALEEIHLVDNAITGVVPVEMCALSFTVFSIDCQEVQCDCCTSCDNDFTDRPTFSPTTKTPTVSPTENPSGSPTQTPTVATPSPTIAPTTMEPTRTPVVSEAPTERPTLQPTTDCTDSIQVEKECYAPGEEIVATFRNCDARGNDWIGLYDEGSDPDELLSPHLWVWSCGDQNCFGAVTEGSVVFNFQAQGASDWPLDRDPYQVYIARRGVSGGPYQSFAWSEPFEVSNKCN